MASLDLSAAFDIVKLLFLSLHVGFFFNVSPPKEDNFPGHLRSPIFQLSYTITVTNFLLTSEGIGFRCLLFQSKTILQPRNKYLNVWSLNEAIPKSKDSLFIVDCTGRLLVASFVGGIFLFNMPSSLSCGYTTATAPSILCHGNILKTT